MIYAYYCTQVNEALSEDTMFEEVRDDNEEDEGKWHTQDISSHLTWLGTGQITPVSCQDSLLDMSLVICQDPHRAVSHFCLGFPLGCVTSYFFRIPTGLCH